MTLKGIRSKRKEMPFLYTWDCKNIHRHSYLLLQVYWVTNLPGRKQLALTFHSLGQLIISRKCSILRYILCDTS